MDRRQQADRPTLPSLPEIFPDRPDLVSPSRSYTQPYPESYQRRPALIPPPSGLQPPGQSAHMPRAGSGQPPAYAQPPPRHVFPPPAHPSYGAQHTRGFSMPTSPPPRPSSAAPFFPGGRGPAYSPRPATPGRVEYGLLQLGDGTLQTLRTDSQRPIDRYRPQPAMEDTRPKNHVCPYCSAAYSRRSALEIHIRRHTGERPFVCTLCSRDYMSVSNLNRHYRQSHPTVEAPGDEAA